MKKVAAACSGVLLLSALATSARAELIFCPYLNALGYSWLKKELDLGAWRIDCRDVP